MKMNFTKLVKNYLVPALGLILAVDAKISSTAPQQMRYTEASNADILSTISGMSTEVEEMKKAQIKESLNTQIVKNLTKPLEESTKLTKLIEQDNMELDKINSAISEAEKIGTVPAELLNNQKNIINNMQLHKENLQSVHKELSDIIVKNSEKSDISDTLTSLIDNYREFLVTLDSDQLVAWINFFGFYLVLVAILSITFVTIGDIIIEKLKLETRFPKLANIIRLQQKIRKGYLYTNIFILYIVVISFIICNFYMIFF